MFPRVFLFELRYHLKSRLFAFSAAVFFLLAYLGMVSPNVQIGALGGANYNSPFAIVQTHVVMALLAVLVGTAFFNSAALRDAEFRMDGIVFSTRIDRLSYVLARFLGAFAAIYLAYLATSLGFVIASFMPWLDQELIGPFVPVHYLYAVLVVGLPVIFANSAIAYAVAVLGRDQRWSWAAIIALLVLYQVTSAVLGQLEYRELASLVDPTGSAAMTNAAQYWTVFERNSEVVPLSGTLLANRLLWMAIGIGMLVITVNRFRFEIGSSGKRKPAPAPEQGSLVAPAEFPRQKAVPGATTAFRQFLARLRFEVGGVLRSVFFWVLVALAVAISLGSFFGLSNLFGTSVYPVTRVLSGLLQGTVTLALMIVMVFYGADLVWRDREARFQELLGSTPTPSWAFVLAKIVAGVVVVAVFLATNAVVAILFQLFNGYTQIEPMLYVGDYFYTYGMIFYLAVVLSIVLQILASNKYLGMLLMVLYILAIMSLPNAGWEDPLYLYGLSAATLYSDMNGFGGLLGVATWYYLYWACGAVLLGVLGYLVWDRGPKEQLRSRLRNLGERTSPGSRRIAMVAGTGFIALFGWIFYNTHILNDYVTDDDQRYLAAEYERRYIEDKGRPVPRITDISVAVDLYPEENRFEVSGTYSIENREDDPIESVLIGFGWDTDIRSVELEGAERQEYDPEFNVHRFRFEPPLQPGEQRELSYEGGRAPRGFRHDDNIPDLLFGGGGVFGNGTFVNSIALGPYLGFSEGFVITDRADRRREGLDPVPRYPDLDDASEWRNSYLTQDADWVTFEAMVTTSADQTAIAPGYLEEESVEGDRRRFHYRMDAPMQNLYSVLSARYAVARDNWNGVDLAVYYHPPHDGNVDRMLASLRKSLEYFSSNFSPYQYRQMRVLEFPAYANFAQSFPNTVPWSEALGFIADIRDPEDIDYVFYVGAHEVAHQWWGHQVSSAKVQGQTTLVETLAQYSALMVMEQEYGPHMMRRFLKYELDSYLSGRGGEAIEELPLYRVENQPYIHYRKGSVVMYAIRDALGEEAVNRALARLIEEAAYRYDPYPTSRDLLRVLRAEANTGADTEDVQALITDLFEKITLWDLKADSLTVSERADGRYDVALKVSAAKYEADGEGRQSEVPLDMRVDVALFTQHPDDVTEGDSHVLVFEKRRITSGDATLEFVVDRPPTHAGIDPYNKLIDRNSEDNISAVDG
jgi:ABC-2 type transport system permease protein